MSLIKSIVSIIFLSVISNKVIGDDKNTKTDLGIQKLISMEIKSLQRTIEELAQKLEMFNEEKYKAIVQSKEISKFLETISTYVEPFYEKLDMERQKIETMLNKKEKEKINIPSTPE